MSKHRWRAAPVLMVMALAAAACGARVDEAQVHASGPVESYLFVAFNAHDLCSYSLYFVANQEIFTSPSTALNSGSPVRSSTFFDFAKAAAKQSA